MQKRTTSPQAVVPRHAEVSHTIHSLLLTMRIIAQYEERFCIILNDIKHEGILRPTIAKELHALLEEVPAGAFEDDLRSIRAALTGPAATCKPATKAPVRRPATKVLRATAKKLAKRTSKSVAKPKR